MKESVASAIALNNALDRPIAEQARVKRSQKAKANDIDGTKIGEIVVATIRELNAHGVFNSQDNSLSSTLRPDQPRDVLNIVWGLAGHFRLTTSENYFE
jgi:hypothetical protein